MPDINWIKLSVNTFDDEKLLIIDSMPDADAVEVMWFKLICQAGKCNSGGWIWLSENQPYTDEMLSAVFHRPLNTVRLALDIFKKLGMIEIDERGIFLPGFAKHNNLEKMEIIREQAKLRMRDYRKRNNIVTSVTVTPQIRLEEDKKKNREEDTLQGASAPLNPIECCFTFADYRNVMDTIDNHVGFLVNAFKRIHSSAPVSDFENAGGRLGKLWASNNRDTGYILKIMWDTASESIAGSHLSYIQGKLKRVQNPHKDPDHYVKGKYGHMVAR